MNARNHIYLFYSKDEATEKQLRPLIDIAKEKGFSIVSDSKDANIVISVGGDGAFLQAVRKTGFRQDCLYMGLRTMRRRVFIVILN
ncbi:NAD+ kinase [Salinibacillus kushneri]|uniref:NAD+ kinase n=1 Tax=Salinibacillus kushneri TaxID=237682 RepID=A0A1I0H8C2_9BACI|nr:hypothetical protein [Salinibacillus kushneri]SET80011.1 NAD+ kinase [Salinibacillus kushneri]